MHVFSLYGVLDDYKSDISRLRNKCDYFGHIYFCIVVKCKVFFLYSIGIEATAFAYFLLCFACFFLCSRSCSEIACKFVGITQYEDGERFLRVLSVHPCSFNFVHVSISLAMTGCRSRDNNEVDRRKNSARELSGLWLLQRLHGRAQDFSLGTRPKGREREWGSWEGSATPSHQLGSLKERCGSPSGVRVGAPTAQTFSTVFTLRMASPDTIILLIVDYHTAIGGKTPYHPCVRA